MLYEPDLDAARHHLLLLAGEADPLVAWQVFDDSKSDPSLARGFHGRLDDVLPQLAEAQHNGCGVYVAVNQTNGRGRRKENMRYARACFLDLDGAPLPTTWPVEPHLLIHSSSVNGIDKFQAWWLIEPTKDWDRWQRMQKALALEYGGDLKCSLTTQIGRCAGFWHLKRPDQPWQVRIIADNVIDETARSPLDPLVEQFGFDLDAVRLPKPRREQVDRPPPAVGWDSDLDVAAARRLVADEANWVPTSDGGVSVYKMACRLRDLGISKGLCIELIANAVPVFPDSWPDDHVERKAGNAFAYARGEAGAWSREADRLAMIAALDEPEPTDIKVIDDSDSGRGVISADEVHDDDAWDGEVDDMTEQDDEVEDRQ